MSEGWPPIPFQDLSAQSAVIRSDVFARYNEIVDGNAFILGEDVSRFEDEFGAFLGGAHVVGISNGTDALELAIRALGLEAGSEVLVPANSFVASALSVVRAGLTVRFVDVEPVTLLAQVDDYEKKVTSRTRAIMPVHLYGQCAPLDDLLEFAAARGLKVIEDAAQSQGAKSGDLYTGTVGDIAATSFYPGKNLGAWGDAGGVITRDVALADTVRLLRNYGSSRRYHHDRVGFNCRLDTFQAAVLSAKLPYLNAWNDQRRQQVALYDKGFSECDTVEIIPARGGENDVCHLYVIRVDDRDDLIAYAAARGIQLLVHYPVPIPRHSAFISHSQHRDHFPATDRAAERIVSLPVFPGMRAEQVERVVEVVREFAVRGRR